MVASLRGNTGMGTKEDESSTGCVWTAGPYYGPFSPGVHFEIYELLFLKFSKFFQTAVDHGYGGPEG